MSSRKRPFFVSPSFMRAGEKKKNKLGNLNSSMSSLGPKSHFLAIRSFQQGSHWGCLELQKKNIIFFWSWWTQYITLQTISGSKHPVFIAYNSCTILIYWENVGGDVPLNPNAVQRGHFPPLSQFQYIIILRIFKFRVSTMYTFGTSNIALG